jgi:mono/diheme cytochrome c family protein
MNGRVMAKSCWQCSERHGENIVFVNPEYTHHATLLIRRFVSITFGGKERVMKTFGSFIGGAIIGAILVPLAVYVYFVTGKAPVATSAPPMPFEKMLAHKALDARVDREMPRKAPIEADEANLVAGARIYRDHCAVCHGLAGQPESAIALGMYPHPPKLLEGTGVTDDEPGESYWKVANGIRLTGMPGFGRRLSETQIWQVSLLVADADKLPKSAKDILAPAASAESPK